MKKAGKYVLVLIGLLMFLSSCQKDAGEDDREEIIYESGFLSASEKGVLFSGNTDKVYFYDYQTDEVYPLCARPNCAHAEEDCLAVRANLDPAFYGGHLYYWRMDFETGGFWLIEADPDGGNEREVTKLTYGVFSVDDLIICGGKAYMNALGLEDKEESQEAPEYIEDLISVDLKDGTVKVLGRVTHGEDGGALWSLIGADGDRVFVSLFVRGAAKGELEAGSYYVDVREDKLYPIEMERKLTMRAARGERVIFLENFYEEEFEEAGKRAYWCWNPDTGEMEQIGELEEDGRYVLLEEGFAYIASDSDYRNVEWRFYCFEDGTTKILREYKEGEFEPEEVVMVNGKEMILGWCTEKKDGKKIEGQGIISAEDFLEGKENYRFLCPVNNGR